MEFVFFMRKLQTMKQTLFLLAAVLISVTALRAQKVEVVTNDKPGWHKIGETHVDFKTDKDVVKLIGADKFKALQIKAVDAPVHIEDMQVVYENGEPEDIPVRYDFKQGTESRAIDLKGYERKIKEINFVYRTVPNWKGDRAHIEIYGLK
jgi:hypothetical protein